VSRAGFVGLAGRPNVGKSTLVNSLVGHKVAITSEVPQTTRRAVRGIAESPEGDAQIILVDLPGVQRPRDVLTQRMQRRVERELGGSDAVLFLLNAEQGVGPGDRFIAGVLLGAGVGVPVICAVNKIDRLRSPGVAEVLAAAADLPVVDEVFPISARTGTGLQALCSRLGELMPEGPDLYPRSSHSDQASEVLLAELIREQVIRRTRDEIPHSVEVSVNEIEERDDGLVTVHAHVWADTESQKGILVGKGGQMVRDIGTGARRELERELGAHVHLDLSVRVRRGWRGDDDLLDRLGID